MDRCFMPVQISKHVYWVGAIDTNIRDFHGYETRRGTTYNAYLIMGKKVALIDTVKAPFKEEMISRISKILPPGEIDYIVSNHAERDHSGSLAAVMEEIKPQKVFASRTGVRVLRELFDLPGELTPVNDGDKVNLGDMNLTFLETRMLHWPDSMITYLNEDELLFSQDGFGMHLATFERFYDQLDPAILEYEAATYFANILMPYSGLITKLIERVVKMGIPLKMIAPDHGPIWRGEGIGRIIDLYQKWARRKTTSKGVIVYGTMWGNTELMARALAEGMAAGGAKVKLMSTDAFHRSDVMYELLDAGALLVGSSTLNNHLLPSVADVLTYIKGLRPKDLLAQSFGSYGWSGEAVGQIEEYLKAMKAELAGEGIKVKNRPGGTVLEDCYKRGLSLAEILREGSAAVRTGD